MTKPKDEQNHSDMYLDMYNEIKINDTWIIAVGNAEREGNLSLITIVGKETVTPNLFNIYCREKYHTNVLCINLEDFYNLRIKKMKKNESLQLRLDTWYEHKTLSTNKFVVGYNFEKVWYRIDDNEYIITESLKDFLKSHKEKKNST